MNDLISRQVAIALADTLKDDVPDDERIAGAVIAHNEGILEYQTKLSLLPPAKPKWIPCSERMPEEHEWIGTNRFGTTISVEVYVTFENPNGERFTKHLSFQNGKLSSFDQREIDVFHKGSAPIAWMPLPEPYKGGQR